MRTDSLKLTIVKCLPSRLANRYVKYLMQKESQGKSKIGRQYFSWRYKVDVGLYSYGGCFDPSFNIGGTVKIGKYCSIAGDVHYFGANHPISHVSTSAYFYNKSFGLNVIDVSRECLEIGNDVWIGYGVIILSGCHKIGNGAVIGAGSIVTRDVPPYAIVAGNPAHIIKYRFDEKRQKILESSQWWDEAPEQVMKHYEFIDDVENFVENIVKEK